MVQNPTLIFNAAGGTDASESLLMPLEQQQQLHESSLLYGGGEGSSSVLPHTPASATSNMLSFNLLKSEPNCAGINNLIANSKQPTNQQQKRPATIIERTPVEKLGSANPVVNIPKM